MSRTASLVLLIGITATTALYDIRLVRASPSDAAVGTGVCCQDRQTFQMAATGRDLSALNAVGLGENGTARLLRRHILNHKHLWSMVELGKMYLVGRGVVEDQIEAYTLFMMAAKEGFAPAHFQLGLMHEIGGEVPKIPEVSVAWFRSAAGLGHRDAFAKLGKIYRDGLGIPQDRDKALIWFQAGAKKGCPIALAALLKML